MGENNLSAAYRVSQSLRDRATRCLVAAEKEPLRSQHYYHDYDVDLDFQGYLTIEALASEITRLRAPLKAEKSRQGSAATNRPDGYVRLPPGTTCKCLKLWRDVTGESWCCTPPAGEASSASISSISRLRFSQQCGFIAKNAAAWAADTIDLVEQIDQPERSETVFRFTDEMRARLDRIDKMAGRDGRSKP